MGLFGPSREEREQQQRKQEDTDKLTTAFSRFQVLIDQLRPEWSIIPDYPDNNLILCATCPHGQETLTLQIEWYSCWITDSGDIDHAPHARARFIVQSPTVKMQLLEGSCRRDEHPIVFDWLTDLGQNSAPLVSLRERRLRLKQDLGVQEPIHK